MGNVEHYFENLLHHGADAQGEPNKRALSPEVIDAIECCAFYVVYTLFDGPDDLARFIRRD